MRLLRALGLIVVAALAGFLLARSASHHSASPAPLSRTASTAAYTVHYPSNWEPRTATTVPGLTLQTPMTIGPQSVGSDRLQLGTLQATTVGVSALPASLIRTLSNSPTAATVTIGSYRFDRYLGLRPRGLGGSATVYLLATTTQTIAAICITSGPAQTFAAQCERVLATLRLPSGTAPSAGVDASYALQLNGILSTLNRVRAKAGPGLRASSLKTRAAAARQLAAAEASAGARAGSLAPGAASAANTKLVSALQQAAGAYRALADAALHQARSAYTAAQARLSRAQATLTVAFKQLAALGYRLS